MTQERHYRILHADPARADTPALRAVGQLVKGGAIIARQFVALVPYRA